MKGSILCLCSSREFALYFEGYKLIEFFFRCIIIQKDMRNLTSILALLLVVQLAVTLSLKNHELRCPQPITCGSGKQKIGPACYEICESGYFRYGLDCHQYCLGEWTEQGPFCRLTEYNRGPGFSSKFGEWGDSQVILRCENENGKGNCEQYRGSTYYPKCKPGYTLQGCCDCNPDVPDCESFGYSFTADKLCGKNIIAGQASCS